mmetsp:Transcript_19178/g.28545  ORF Transcript_19178/g.28545 Transcript_19178/m.28545 type:complete len:543 (+) Transcript_19178:45-1673(+)
MSRGGRSHQPYDPQYVPGGGHNQFGQQRERIIYDGKRMRQHIVREVVDYCTPSQLTHETRLVARDGRDARHTVSGRKLDALKEFLLPEMWQYNPASSFTTQLIHTSTNKVRCPVNVVRWSPQGRRLITGVSSGEFTLWNGVAFNFETILQAHDSAVRAMKWTHNANWMASSDDEGVVKYWQSNMNNVHAFKAHREACRSLSFAPTDDKFATGADDGHIKVWDFTASKEESTLSGHGWDVKCVEWHPQKALIMSGSKDNLLKLWDPKTAKNIATLHGHKNTILKLDCNQNGNWLLSASRDQLIKLWDLRMMKERRTFRAHDKEVTSIAWHPIHEGMFASGSFDGTIFFWEYDIGEPRASIAEAHESGIWSLDWHPLGHILCSGSNDHHTRFWTRNRPGYNFQDKYNQQSYQRALALGDISLPPDNQVVRMPQSGSSASAAQYHVPNLLPHQAVPTTAFATSSTQQPKIKDDTPSVIRRQAPPSVHHTSRSAVQTPTTKASANQFHDASTDLLKSLATGNSRKRERTPTTTTTTLSTDSKKQKT